ncbi:MAG: hypothetical protein IJE97_07685, partial [Thermoguttaceae bacterium]|nr:hypothetical protein [Thermoguttaceae bacterium]
MRASPLEIFLEIGYHSLSAKEMTASFGVRAAILLPTRFVLERFLIMLKSLRNFFFVVLASAAFVGAASPSFVVAQNAENTAAYVAPALQEKDAWTMVVIPDPQAYSRYGRNQGIFELMTAWIAENKD